MRFLRKMSVRISLFISAMLMCLSFGVNAKAAPDDPRPNYSIMVNRTQNVVQVFEIKADGSQQLVKSFTCSCGKNGHLTPRGTYHVDRLYEWHAMFGNCYARYCLRFNKNILFHSVPYYTMNKANLEWEEYNLLGTSASLGCVRLAVADCKWLYENCKIGTQVTVYVDEPGAAVIPKPEPIHIPENSPFRGWDPTDDDPANPWLTLLKDSQKENINNVVESIETFDYKAYADRYSDLKEIFGYDRESLYKHYIEHGRFEGRKVIFR